MGSKRCPRFCKDMERGGRATREYLIFLAWMFYYETKEFLVCDPMSTGKRIIFQKRTQIPTLNEKMSHSNTILQHSGGRK